MFCSNHVLKFLIISIALTIASIADRDASAADPLKIKAAISKGQRYLQKQNLTGPGGSVASLALIQSSVDKIDRIMNEMIERISIGRFVNGSIMIVLSMK